jgi:hypothetical protein
MRESRSSTLFARMLWLYPEEIRRQHGAEMLQIFADLERASSSRIALWLALIKDLATSIATHWLQSLSRRSFARQASIVATVLTLLAALTWRGHPDHEPIVLAFCAGYALGWVSGWTRRRAVVALACLGIAISASTGERFLLTFCYGCTLGWIAAWIGNRRRRTAA